MIIVFVAFLACILAAVFIVPLHGYIGAIMIGIDTIGFDILWQWLRFKTLTPKTKLRSGGDGKLLPGVIGGFILRIINIVVFLKLSSWWLSSNEFLCFAIFLLTLPLWSKLVAYKFKSVI